MAKSNFFRRLRTALALIFVFVLIYATNRLDNHHFENIQYIMNSVYEDRIVAQHYIYELNKLYHEKYVQVHGSVKEEAVEGLNRRIDEYIESFSETTLTSKEAQVFRLLVKRNKGLQNLEAQLAAQPGKGLSQADISQYKTKIEEIFDSLDGLSEIQLAEGGRLRKMAQESLDTNSFFSQLELILLAFIGIIIQVIIFYKPKKE